jgi:hypothetical protein
MPTKLVIPDVDFRKVQTRIDETWDPYERNPHIVAFGQTGTGKSYLIRHGILPLRPLARKLVIDVKGIHNRTWDGYGTPVSELPPAFSGDGTGLVRAEYRLIVETDKDDARTQVGAVIRQILSEGHCIVVIDESKRIVDREQLGLKSAIEELIQVGREAGISVIVGAQTTALGSAALKDQPGFVLIGHVPQKSRELAEIIGGGPELVNVIRRIKNRHFLYYDPWDDGIMGMTIMNGNPG